MAKQVEFRNASGQAQYVTTRPLRAEDLAAPTPPVFANDFDGHPTMALADVIAMVFPNGNVDEKPYFYIRHMDMKKGEMRFGNLLELGDDFLSPQKGVIRAEEVAQAGTPISEYRAVEGGASTYGFGSEEPKSAFVFSPEHYLATEGDFFRTKGELWPNAIFEHRSMYNNVSTIIQAATHSGILNGDPVLGLGEHDRLFIPEQVNGFDGITANFGYFYMNMIGIRPDNRREQALISIDNSGKNLAYYYIDGEDPIVTDTVSMEADWVHLPYVDDGTCVYKDAIFRFAGKEFHFEGRWGSKGFTPEPRVAKHGQSQVFGTWYEGSTPYRHKLFMTLGENMEAYDHRLRDMGFDVVT